MAKFRASLVQEGGGSAELAHKPLEFLYERFTGYIEDRRRAPRDDIMTEMAQATFPDGTLPPVDDVMRISANLFSAGGRPRPGSSPCRSAGSATVPTSSSGCATTPSSSRRSSRNSYGSRAR